MIEKNSGSAKRINTMRWRWTAVVYPKIVLDYGCGCCFLTQYAPDGITVDSYDIGTLDGDRLYPQTGILHDHYDLIFFNDVLEHVDWENEPDNNILDVIKSTDHIAVAVPVKPTNNSIKNWKHYKPGEHLSYFTRKSLNNFFEDKGFKMIVASAWECPPREDIWSVLYRSNEFEAKKIELETRT